MGNKNFMTSQELLEQKIQCKKDLVQICQFEIDQMQKVLNLMNSQKWEQVDFQMTLKHPEQWKSIISKFNFGNCIPKKYIIAMKKLCKLAFEDGIKQKKEQLEALKINLSIKSNQNIF